jgi:putative membrane protein
MSETHAQMLSWLVVPTLTCTLVATALVYLRGWISLRSAFPTLIAGWRLAAFMSGLALVWTAVGSPLATLDHQSLTIHMMKHLLLMTVAAPLILAGAPAFPLVCGLPKLFIKSHRPLASVPGQWLERCLRHPVLCWLAGTAAVIGWHIPIAFQLGMRSRGMHILEDISFLVAGLLFWWPIVHSWPSAARSPRWSMALYLFLATLPCDILSAFLVFCNRLVYPFYLSTPQLFSLLPLEDQECAGALMWVWVTFAYLIPAVAITVQMLSPSNTQWQGQIQAAPHRVAGRSRNGAEAEGALNVATKQAIRPQPRETTGELS